MALQIKKAVKYNALLRMSIAGPSGSGKTFTALKIGHEIADGKPVLVVDTERGSASKYADIFPPYDVIELDTFSPLLYVEAIKAAVDNGYGVVILDSLSHAWNGTGGLLEMVDSIAKRKYNGNSFAAWKDATPIQNQLIDAMTRANVHIITTMRSKQEYVLEKDERSGKTQPKKMGMAPVQREGMEYEMDIAVDMDIDNTMIVQKSRCPALSGQIYAKPGANVASIIKPWLLGAPAPVIVEPQPPIQLQPAKQGEGEVVQEVSQEAPTVSALRARAAEIKVSSNGSILTFEQFYQGVTKQEYVSDDAISPEACQKINRQLDVIVKARENRQQAS